jgi:hypothetical protein
MDHDDIWNQAIQEAYALAPAEEVILHTLELTHSSMPNAIRVVADHGDSITIDGTLFSGHYLTLEDDYPGEGGESVFFQSCMFDFELPEQKLGSLPQIQISLDNVTRELMEYVDAIIAESSPLQLTYREYLYSDKETPQFILTGLSMKRISCTLTKVTGTAEFSDLINRSFPNKVYRPEEFRGLLE